MRVAEQRSKRGRGPRGLFEGEHKNERSHVEHSSPSSAAARVCEVRQGFREALLRACWTGIRCSGFRREPRQPYRRGDREPRVSWLSLRTITLGERESDATDSHLGSPFFGYFLWRSKESD